MPVTGVGRSLVAGGLILTLGTTGSQASTKVEAIGYMVAWRMYVTNHCPPWQMDDAKARAFLPDFPEDALTRDAIQRLAVTVYGFMEKRGSVADRCSEAVRKFGPGGWNVLYRE